MIIEGLIDGVKKKITLADEKDKKEGTKDQPIIFREGTDTILKHLDFKGFGLIKDLEQLEKMTESLVKESDGDFYKFLQEMKQIAQSKIKRFDCGNASIKQFTED